MNSSKGVVIVNTANATGGNAGQRIASVDGDRVLPKEKTSAPRTQPGNWLNPDPARLLKGASAVLLVVWCVWWGATLVKRDLVGMKRAWFPACFGVDFIWHVDKPTRVWLAGGDPYEDKSRMCSYPPLIFRMFAWVGWMTPETALTVWVCAVGGIAALGAWAAWKVRRRIGLDSIPLSTVLVAMLFSTPLVFAMERGQYDIVTVPIVLAALPFLRGNTRWRQVLAGAILALAPWAKVYPGLMGIGLAGLRKWDALAGFAIVGLAIGAAIPGDTQRFLVNNELHMLESKAISNLEKWGRVHPWNHSLSDNWHRIWGGTPLEFLSYINGYVATCLLLGPVLIWVSYRVFACRERERLAFPYLMWIVSAAAFVPPVANDYSLVFLPLAVLAVYSRRDPLLCRLAIFAMAFWWQPIAMPINGRLLILIKLAGLFAIGVSLAERACELQEAAEEIPATNTSTATVPLRLAA
jgi:hypothetical protein